MSELHEEFMSIRGTTDVLTFPLDEDEHGNATSGEVVLCVPEAQRQARQRDIPPRVELLLYAIHGMLHLLGYDDRTDRAYRVMHHTEDEIMTELGLGTVFSRPASWHGFSTRALSKSKKHGLKTRATGKARR